MPCVVSQNGDQWTIDIESEFYPRLPKAGYLPQPVASQPDLIRTDAPSFLAKVKNFASSAVQHVAAGLPMCSDEEIIRRHDICLTCEHLQKDACSLCGCPLARVRGYVSKLSWADQECPAGKWGKAVSKTSIDP
jgi:ribosomal protein L37E